MVPQFVDGGPFARGKSLCVGGQRAEFGGLADFVVDRVALDRIPPFRVVAIDRKPRRRSLSASPRRPSNINAWARVRRSSTGPHFPYSASIQAMTDSRI